MKNILLGVVTVGVAYLVFCQYKKSKGKCSCTDKAATSTAGGSDTTGTPSNIVAETASVTPALAANGMDGFKKGYF